MEEGLDAIQHLFAHKHRLLSFPLPVQAPRAASSLPSGVELRAPGLGLDTPLCLTSSQHP